MGHIYIVLGGDLAHDVTCYLFQRVADLSDRLAFKKHVAYTSRSLSAAGKGMMRGADSVPVAESDGRR